MGELFYDSQDICGPGTNDRRKIEIDRLGIWVTPVNAREAAKLAVNAAEKQLLLNHNLHSVYLHDRDDAFRSLYGRADWVIVDGAPVLWLASRSAGHTLSTDYRITSTDWIDVLPSLRVVRRLFVFGSTLESNARAVQELRRRLPQWSISGIAGYGSEEDAVKRILEFEPDLVLVGLGMPRQERFILRNLAQLPDATYATVGGAIDYLAGATRLAPRWVGRMGMEWAWRLALEPRRLAHRYLIEPLLLALRVGMRAPRNRRLPRP